MNSGSLLLAQEKTQIPFTDTISGVVSADGFVAPGVTVKNGTTGLGTMTTKKGSAKAPVIEVRYQHSINQLTHKLPQLNAQQYRKMQSALLEYSNGEGKDIVSTVVRNVLSSQMADSLRQEVRHASMPIIRQHRNSP
jgi:hypothetical protein